MNNLCCQVNTFVECIECGDKLCFDCDKNPSIVEIVKRSHQSNLGHRLFCVKSGKYVFGMTQDNGRTAYADWKF